jgi:hypothetical protein
MDALDQMFDPEFPMGLVDPTWFDTVNVVKHRSRLMRLLASRPLTEVERAVPVCGLVLRLGPGKIAS